MTHPLPRNRLRLNYQTFIALLLWTACAVAGQADDTKRLDYRDLVRRLVDVQQLAEPPAIGERGAMASSYDRASHYDAATGKYVDWDANNDGDGIVRREGEEEVLAEITGPGCIWRMWAATPERGRVRIILDGVVAVDLPWIGYFDGTSAPFNRANLVYKTAANGYNNYTPIPFQKSCKIVAAKGWGKFYHFNYTQFPAGTVVPTFSLPLVPAAAAALDEVNAQLGRCGPAALPAYPGQMTERRTVTVPAGGRATVADFPGAGAITGLRVKFPLPAEQDAQRVLLRQLALRITWDGQAQPAVWVPWGDFFGNAASGAIPHQTWLSGLTDDGRWFSHWYMPYESRAVIAVDNDSPEPVTMEWEVLHAPLPQPPESLLRFHAKWHGDVFPPGPDRAIDWTLLVTQGRGRFVGTQLHVWNPRPGWWGEGDEKFHVDGEKFPSTFGTGTEDYFGYAWSSTKTFVQAFHSQPWNESYSGHVSGNRWHVADNVPFQTGFEAAIEKYFDNDTPTRFDAVAFWYLAPGGTDPFEARPVAERLEGWVRPVILREPDVLEAERFKVVRMDPRNGGTAHPADVITWYLRAAVCSGDWIFIWWANTDARQLVLSGVTAPQSGKYQIYARLVSGDNFGIVQLGLDDVKLGEPVDCYAPNTLRDYRGTDAINLGTIELVAGPHSLSVQVMGQNERAKGRWFAIDYLKLVPIP